MSRGAPRGALKSSDLTPQASCEDVPDHHPPHLRLEIRFGEVELLESDATELHPEADAGATSRVEVVAPIESGVQVVDVVDVHEEPP